MKASHLKLVSIKNCFCYQDIIKKLKLPVNGTSNRLVKEYIKLHNLDISHFDRNRKNRVHSEINKICPVNSCNKKFITNTKDNKVTCSGSCANTYFRSGKNHPNYKKDSDSSYRTLCFRYHKKECVICKENLIVAVHHFDENHENNSIENLIPLCPTHHTYIHSKHKHLVIDKVLAYRENFITK